MFYLLSKSAISGYSDIKNGVTAWDKAFDIIMTIIVIIFCIALVSFVCIGMIRKKAGIKPQPKSTVELPAYRLICIDREKSTTIEVFRNRPVILPIPEREGYGFCGWYLDSAHTIPFDQRKKYKKDTVLYAKWAKEG